VALTDGVIMANNPTIPAGYTGFEPEIQDITRQRDMAKLLLQQGMNMNDMGGQMVSGRFVGASPWQGIAKLYSAYKGGKLSREADAKQAQLIEALRRVGVEESKDIMGLARGQQATPDVIPQFQTLRDDQGELTMGATAGREAVAPDIEGAYIKAVGGRSPQAQALAQILGKQLMREPKWEMKGMYNEKTGNTDLYQYDANALDPSKTMRKVGVEKPALSAKDVADLRDKGITIPFGGGQGAGGGGVSMGGGQTVSGGQGGQVTGDAKYMPSNLPTYQYDPSLSPAQNRELQGKFAEDLRKNVKNARDAFGTIQSVAEILSSGKPSSGRGENIITGTREFFGGGGEQSKTDAQLRVLGQKLVQQVPRFEGPQSDKDVASYQAAAGDIGNPNMPIETRMAALQTLVDLNKKYYPNGDWDKIDLAGPVRTKQTFFKGSKTMSPTEFRKGLTGQDQEAFDWARRNPNDPRATEIRNRLGF
jgi:hypothetical protein